MIFGGREYETVRSTFIICQSSGIFDDHRSAASCRSLEGAYNAHHPIYRNYASTNRGRAMANGSSLRADITFFVRLVAAELCASGKER